MTLGYGYKTAGQPLSFGTSFSNDAVDALFITGEPLTHEDMEILIKRLEDYGVGRVKKINLPSKMTADAIAPLYQRMLQKDGFGITSLHLSEGRIPVEKTFLSQEFLTQNTVLQEFVAYGQVVEEPFEPGLRYNRALQTLVLDECHITAALARPLLADIALNKSVTQFSLSNNMLGATGIKDCAAMLKQNNTLTSINMTGCGLNADTIEPIISALWNRPFTTEFWGKSSNENEDWVPPLTLALKNHPHLWSVGFEDNTTAHKNRDAAAQMIDQLQNPQGMTQDDFDHIGNRLPLILTFKETSSNEEASHIATQRLTAIQNAANTTGKKFEISSIYQPLVSALTGQLKPLTEQELHAQRAYFEKAYDWTKASTDDLLHRPMGAYFSVIDVLMAEGKAAPLFTPDHWQGRPRDLQRLFDAVPRKVTDDLLGGEGHTERLLSTVKQKCLVTGKRRFSTAPRP